MFRRSPIGRFRRSFRRSSQLSEAAFLWQRLAAGQAEVVYSMPENYSVGPEGRDEYRCFVIPTGTTEDKWVTGMDSIRVTAVSSTT